MQPLRALLLWLSRRRVLGAWLQRVGLSQRVVARFVAGLSHEAAIATARPYLERGFTATFSYLGEDVESEAEADAAVSEYCNLLEAVTAAGIATQTKIAIKPSLLGLAVGQQVAEANLEKVATAAATVGVELELDMERSDSVEATLALYRSARATQPELGVAIQAALRRTPADLEALIEEGIARVRIVKGAYAESAAVAYAEAEKIASAFHGLVRMALEPQAMEREGFLAIGTHDQRLIAGTRTRVFRRRTAGDRWEVQMLYGVRPRLQDQLLGDGYPVRIYFPYGRQWYPYFTRRLAERPANLWFALQQLLRR